MKVIHDSRNARYRSPYGAVSPQTPVELAVDVFGAPDATVMLRTWVDGVGEQVLQMVQDDPSAPAVGADGATAEDATAGRANADQRAAADRPVRHRVIFTPQESGIVWYHFIISDPQGSSCRYGAKGGRVGGEGELKDWEPPSFQLTVCGKRIAPPAWNEFIGSYLYNEDASRDLVEAIETIRENYPFDEYRDEAPWAAGDKGDVAPLPEGACGDISYRKLVPTCSSFQCFVANDDVFGFWRCNRQGNPLCVLVNTSIADSYDVLIPMVAESVSEIVGGFAVPVVEASAVDAPCSVPGTSRFASAHLGPLGYSVLHFHPSSRMEKLLEPGLGVLAHITSVPADGPGSIGGSTREFVDWLAQAGVRYWQVLPVNPTDEFGSPYAGISAFAGNVHLIEGGMEAAFSDRSADELPDEYRAFCEREADWLEPHAAFMAIRQKLNSKVAWQEWPEPYRSYDPAFIVGDEELNALAESWRRAQFAFERRWGDLRSHAEQRGVKIIGDMPIYVSADSSDVWANSGIFQLDRDGCPRVVAGCPPDAFAEDGQVWGNPIYDWDSLAADGYRWWMRRLQRSFALYDAVRLDHFIGFVRYFSIPAGEKATAGRYHPGPGTRFFRKAHELFGQLPIIAEDLGLITPNVRSVLADCGFPGMDIVQFADGDPLDCYRPRPEKIVYTGTHDNQTLAGFAASRYPGQNAGDVSEALMKAAVTCPAPICILPLQDIIGLDDNARMNIPGVAEGNWRWQAADCEVFDALDRAHELVNLHAGLRYA